MLDELTPTERSLLLRFVCAFAWADLEVKDQEREFVRRLVEKLQIDELEREQVEEWLSVGVPPDAVDPKDVPLKHKELFLRCAREVIVSDGEIDPEEHETLRLLEQLVR